ncbi:MAG: hypothetical protein RIA65_12760, partial [Woeseia sp.]
ASFSRTAAYIESERQAVPESVCTVRNRIGSKSIAVVAFAHMLYVKAPAWNSLRISKQALKQ